MVILNLPRYRFNIKNEEGKSFIFDELRRKFVALTPEEWVRQNFLKYLVTNLNYPAGLVAVEYEIRLNKLAKRCDAVVFSRQGLPAVILEFKAPEVLINQAVFDQITVYNMALMVNYLIVSNGLKHYCCKINTINKKYAFLTDIPAFEELQTG